MSVALKLVSPVKSCMAMYALREDIDVTFLRKPS